MKHIRINLIHTINIIFNIKFINNIHYIKQKRQGKTKEKNYLCNIFNHYDSNSIFTRPENLQIKRRDHSKWNRDRRNRDNHYH